MTPEDPRHGTMAGYHVHSRTGAPIDDADSCGCRRANARYENERRLKVLQGRPRIVPTLGLRRRVQALQWSGWTLQAVANEAGWRWAQSVDQVLIRETCNARSAARIVAAYEKLSRLTPPDTHGTKIARSVARRNGYAPAAAWDDFDNPAENPKGVRDAA